MRELYDITSGECFISELVELQIIALGVKKRQEICSCPSEQKPNVKLFTLYGRFSYLVGTDSAVFKTLEQMLEQISHVFQLCPCQQSQPHQILSGRLHLHTYHIF